MSIPEYFLAGSLTGLIVSFVEGPIDLFKSQLQVNYKNYNGLIDCASKIAKNHGIRGVYQGLGPTLVRDVIANGAYFGVYGIYFFFLFFFFFVFVLLDSSFVFCLTEF
jgi:solute carrier family 25 carnitine/acylcarnitine transporter 20/29